MEPESRFGEVTGASAGWKGFERKGQEEPESKYRRRGSAAKGTTCAKGGGDGRWEMARARAVAGISEREAHVDGAGSARTPELAEQMSREGSGYSGGERLEEAGTAWPGKGWGQRAISQLWGAWETAWRAHRTL